MLQTIHLPLQIGARTIAEVKRRLVRVPVSLEQARGAELPSLPALPADADGYLITSLARQLMPALTTSQASLIPFVRKQYHRCYAALDLHFEGYLESFSSKSRSTLKRKVRKLAEASGGRLDVRTYRTADELELFHAQARLVSERTYQERLLSAGLPEGDEFVARLRELGARDQARAWLLFFHQRPISYLYAPADGDTLIYAYLGYDPDYAAASPGTVLQFEAMRQLMDERRFRLFDFTEGEGQHKRLFGTGAVECVDLLLVRPTLRNRSAGHLLNGFDAAIMNSKGAVRRLRLEKLARFVTR